MGNTIEELAIGHQQKQDAAMREARGLSNQVLLLMYEPHEVNRFISLDLDAVSGLVARLRDQQTIVREEGLAFRQMISRT